MHGKDVIAHKTPTQTQMRRELLMQKVKLFYDHMGYDQENMMLHLDKFELKNEKGVNVLYYRKNGILYNVSKKADGSFKTPGEVGKIISKKGSVALGQSRPDAIKKLDLDVPTLSEFEHIPLQEISNTSAKISDDITELNHDRLSPAAVSAEGQLPMRELLGLDKALQRIQGEFVNSTAKLNEYDTKIAKEHKKLDEADTDQERKLIEKRILKLNEEREVRLEAVSQLKEKLQSQFARIRQTIDKIADKDRTLKERLKILWREQGLTLVSVLTAIGMTVSTLILALLLAEPQAMTGGAGSGGSGGKSPHKVRDWVKKSLTSLARLFGKLAKWALAALPGAIGSIISALFSLLKSVVTFAAEHAYAALGFVVALLSYLIFRK